MGPGYMQTGHSYRLPVQAQVEQLAKPNAITLAALAEPLRSKDRGFR